MPPQLPMVAHLVHMYHRTWPPCSRLLCGELTAEEQHIMQRTCPVWKQHQQHQLQLRELQGSARKSAAAVSAAAWLLLLSNGSILLQQLIRMTAAAGDSHHPQQQQQQQLSAAVLYSAESSGRVLSHLYETLLKTGAGQPGVDGHLSLVSKQCCCVLARALQTFEAAVRYCVRVSSTLPASSSTGTSSSSSSSCCSEHVVPPAISHLEASVVGMYAVLIGHGYGSKNRRCSSSSSGSLRGLSCCQHQLLQAMLSMLLTSAKVWQQGLQPAVCPEVMWDVTLSAAFCRKRAEESQLAVCPLDTPAESAAAAAAAAALEVAGGVQIAHLVTRQLIYLDRQLRKWLDAGKAVNAANWLAAGPPPQVVATRKELRAAGVDASCQGSDSESFSQLEVLLRLVQASYDIVGSAASADTNSLGLDAAQQRVEALYPPTKMLMNAVVRDMLVGLKGKVGGPSAWVPDASAQPKVLALQRELNAFVDALQGYGSALAAAVASRFGCNWPGCVRLSGVSEGYGLVRGQACVCGGCRQAR